MTQLMLLLSGAVVSVVLVVNEPFVTWWVGAPRYAGFDLTLLFVVAMVLRHWNLTTVYTLFCFGYERRLALTAIAEGLVAVAAMVALVPVVGLRGAVLASLIATCAVALPANLHALLREQEVTLSEALTPLRPWLVRFAVFLTGVALFVSFWPIQGVLALLAAGSGVGILYGVVMWSTLFVSPLGPMVRHQLQPLVGFVPGLARRLAGEGST
jgi:O-antigen/teichoic acid export membrane protein